MITAKDIEGLLATRHSQDVFIPQCKTGPTQCADGLRIMDAWAMAKSWANPLATAYEIKVSRSDFVNDNKWRGYLDYCNSFYFVCPPKLIQPEELPKDTGLLWVSSTGTKLLTKRKAPYRDVPIPEDLYRYILMCRTRTGPDKEETVDYWCKWLMDKDARHVLGRSVSKALQVRLAEQVSKVTERQTDLEHKIRMYERVQKICEDLGIDLDHPWRLESRIKQAVAAIPPGLIDDMEIALAKLKTLTERDAT